MATSTSPPSSLPANGSVGFETAQGAQFHASVVRLTHHRVVFEIYTPAAILRVSDVLINFRIVVGEATAYSGRAVVSKTIQTGAVLVCEAELAEGGLDIVPLNASLTKGT